MKKFILTITGLFIFIFFSQAQKAGDKVEVLWKGKYYAATVKEVKDGKWFIHYDGYGDNWDEWVGADRIAQKWKVGDKLSVEWNGKWYPAVIKEIKEGKYKIHYDGYGDNWDEWVTTARMKKL